MKKSKLILASLLSVSMITGLASCGEKDPGKDDPVGPVVHVHNLSKVEAMAATCTKDGHFEYYTCDGPDCANLYFNKDGKELQYRDIVDPAHHNLTKHEKIEGLLEGSDEYYSCSACGKFFADAEAAVEISEGSWINEGYAIRFKEGERMTTKLITPVDLNKLKDEDKAVKFDFKFEEDGTTSYYLGSTTANTYNVSGEIKITKSGNEYRTSKGIITECTKEGKEGFVTLVVNFDQFDGDGINRALALDEPVIDIMFGPWDPSAADDDHPWGQSGIATFDSIVDPRSFEITDNNGFVGNHYFPGDDINTGLSTPIAKADLIGKAFELDLKFVTEGTLHFTFFSSGWVGNMTGDIAITMDSQGHYTVNRGEITASTVAEGYMTYKLNFEDFAGDGLNNVGADDIQVIYRDGGTPTCECWVDFNGTRVVDAYPQHPNIVKQTADNVPMLHTYTVSDFANKAVQMKLCIPTEADTTMKLSFFESSWGKGWACDMFVRQVGGVITVTQGSNSLIYEVSAKDAEGWFTLKVNANDLTLGNGFGTAETFSWIMVWQADNNSAISTRDIVAVDALRPLKMPGGWELPAISPNLTKAALEGKALEFEVKFGSTADSDIHLSLYDTVETSGFIADIVVHQKDGAYNATYGAADLKAQCTDLGDGNVKVVINYSEMNQYGMVGAATVGNVIRVWPTDCGTTAGCGVYLDSFKVADRIMWGQYFEKGEVISTGAAHITKEQLQNKAVAFDLFLIEDGEVHITLFDNTWANMSGDILVTKSGDTYTSNVGQVTPCTRVGYEGYITVAVNFIQFKGDGLDRGVDLDVVYGEKGAPTTSLYADFANMRVVDMVPQLQLGDDGDHPCAKFTKAELEGKALQFKAYIPTEDDASVKISFTEHGWNNTFIADIFVKQEAGVLTAYQFAMSASNQIGAQFSEKVDGYVTVTINFYNITPGTEGNFAGTCITWASTTSGCGVDLASFKAVDEVSDPKTFVNGDFKKFGKTQLLQSKLIEEGAISFNVKMEANKTSNVAFMESTWANIGPSVFKSDADGVVSVYYSNGTTPKGKVTALADGWYNVVFNECELNGDGRAASNDAFTHWYVSGDSITVDATSFNYCAPHEMTGTEYTGGAIDVASWSNPQGVNFSYAKEKIQMENCAFAFDFKLVGDGTINMILMGDNEWENITGNFEISKEGDEVTTTYANGKIVSRGEGWYSIYLPSPWTGDGYVKTTWSSMAHFYSGSGYSGDSFTMDWNSIHIVNKTAIPQ